MNKKYFFLFIFLHYIVNGVAQIQHAADSLQVLIKSTSDSTIKVNALISLSKVYQESQNDNSFKYALQALTLSKKVSFTKGLGKSHNQLGDLYWFKADYPSSYDHYFKALKLFEQLKDSSGIADCYRNIGWVYYNQNILMAALSYHNKSLSINIKLNRVNDVVSNYNDLGTVYDELKKYNEAIQSYNSAISIAIQNGDEPRLAAMYNNLGITYYRLGKVDLAIETMKKSIVIAEKYGNKKSLSGSYGNLGSYYTQKGEFESAINAFQKTIDYSKGLDNQILINAYGSFADLYFKKMDFKNAYKYEHLHDAVKNTINKENNSRQINEMMAQFESEKKELMIKSLEKEKTYSDEKLNQEKKFKVFLIAFCFIIAVFASILFKGNIQKKKVNTALSFAYKEIEIKNKDITDSITYSKRIQDASLPTKEMKEHIFPDSFILFKPKDIVSGDFYWFSEKNEKKIIAVCDCTGHGVPGALMSMIGINILNQLVNEKGITTPGEILDNLHSEVRKSLKQHEQEESKDGMDIALIAINNQNEIEFAGANRPLLIVNPVSGSEATIQEIKADRFSIGGLQTEESRIFKNNKLALSKGDCIYIFSDGYVDQFGGPKGKKFMSSHFKELLIAINSKAMPDQEFILNENIENWKGQSEQVDDILVVGIRA